MLGTCSEKPHQSANKAYANTYSRYSPQRKCRKNRNDYRMSSVYEIIHDEAVDHRQPFSSEQQPPSEV